MIIDLDAHQGNGHEKDFANDGMSSTLFFDAFYAHYDDTVIPIFRLQEGFTFWTCTMLEFIPL
jgi:acetoin utilization deacetylase AcuC-like enzyme